MDILAILSALAILMQPTPASAQTAAAPSQLDAASFAWVQMIAQQNTASVQTTRTLRTPTKPKVVSPKLIQEPAPTPAPAPTLILIPAPDLASQVEMAVLQFTNEERTKNGLGALRTNSHLASIARAHSADMLTNNYFSHTNGAGCSGACRMTGAGYAWKSMAENIHMMSGYTQTATEMARKVVTDWMNSPPHRANILNGTFTEAGVGIAIKGSSVYSTTEYALPR